MKKFIVTADIHGSLSSWLTVKALMDKDDALIVAGDLFDTRYGNYSNPDFRPEAIREDLIGFDHPFYYVYGNCDTTTFCPGFEHMLTFKAFRRNVCLFHGHKASHCPEDTDIVIQGHTHLCFLDRQKDRIFLNPGSVTRPRNGVYTYGLIDQNSIRLVELKNQKTLAQIDF